MDEKTGKKTVKSAIWYTFSNFLQKGLAFLTVPIFSRLLSQSEYGEYTNFVTWMAILTTITTFDLFTSVNRARFDFEDDLDNYLSSIVLLGSMVTALFFFVICLFPDTFEALFNMDVLYIKIMMAGLLVVPAFKILQIRNRLFQKYKSVVAISLINAFSTVLIALVLVILSQDKLTARIIGQVLPITAINIVIYIYFLSKGRKIQFKYWKYALLISVPLIPHSLSGILLSSADRIMIKDYIGSVALAEYGLAYNCGLIVSILWLSMNQAFAPWLMNKLHQKNYTSVRKYSQIYLLLFLVVVQFIILLGPELVLILGGKQYYAARFIVPPVAVGYVCQFIYSMYVNIEIYEKKTWAISLGTVAAASVNVGLNIIFIPLYGYIAAAYTTLIGYLCLLLFHYLYVKKLGFISLYDNKKIFMSLAAQMIFAAIILLIYDDNIIRYTVTGIYAIIAASCAYKKKAMLLTFLRRKKTKK